VIFSFLLGFVILSQVHYLFIFCGLNLCNHYTGSSIDLERQELLYIQTDNGYQAIGVDSQYSMSSSKAAFDYNYILGLPPFYELVEAYQSTADHDPEIWGYYYDPALSVIKLLRIENAEVKEFKQSNSLANITFAWDDGEITIVTEQLGIKGDKGVWVPTQIL